MTLVSIALATYNGEQYLPELLDSLLAQTHSDLEICVSDDASTDSTPEILERYQKQDRRIRVVAQPVNLGYQKNFEAAIGMCQGEYIALCDQDDVWKTVKVERLLQAIGDNLLIASDADIVDENLNPSGQTLADVYRLRHNTWTFRELLIKNRYTGCTMMFRESLRSFALPFPRHLPHDWWLVLLAVDRDRFTFTNQNLTLYRQHQKNTIGVQDAVPELIRLKARLRPSMRAILNFHSRKLVRYLTIQHRMEQNGLSNNGRRAVQRLIRFHQGFFLRRIRPKAFVVSIWISRVQGDTAPMIVILGRAFKALVGIKRPDLLRQIEEQV